MYDPEYLKIISKIPHTCKTCEMNFSGKCCGKNYGKKIEDLNDTCEQWDASLNAYCDACEMEED